MSQRQRASGPGPRVLMVNLHSTRNAGDAALMLAAIEQLQGNLSGCSLTLAMNDPAGHETDARVIPSVLALVKELRPGRPSRWRWWAMPILAWLLLGCLAYRWSGRLLAGGLSGSARALLAAYCRADLVVSCPGGFLYSSGRLGLSLILSVYTMALAWIAGKPLYILPQSIGPLARGWERALVRWLLRRARVVMVRDAISLAQAPVTAAERQRIRQLPDMAWTFGAAPRAEAEKWLAEQGVCVDSSRPLLGMTAIDWQAQKPGFQGQARYEQALSAAARLFVEQYGGQVVCFAQVCGPTYDQDDRVPARRIIAQAGLPPRDLCLVDGWSSAAQLKSAYGFMELFVGTRMHSNIFAISSGVPVIAIGYQFKTLGMARTVGLGDWVLDINAVDAALLTQKLAALWQARGQLRGDIARRLPRVEQEVQQAGQLVAVDYAQWTQRPP